MLDVNFIFRLFQTFGFGVAQTGLVVFLLWKIATNHLAHIAHDIKDLSKDVKALAGEVKDMKSHCSFQGERLSKIEGRFE